MQRLHWYAVSALPQPEQTIFFMTSPGVDASWPDVGGPRLDVGAPGFRVDASWPDVGEPRLGVGTPGSELAWSLSTRALRALARLWLTEVPSLRSTMPSRVRTLMSVGSTRLSACLNSRIRAGDMEIHSEFSRWSAAMSNASSLATPSVIDRACMPYPIESLNRSRDERFSINERDLAECMWSTLRARLSSL